MEVRGQQPDATGGTRERLQEHQRLLALRGRARSREAREALMDLAQRTQVKSARAREASEAVAEHKAERRADANRRDRIELSQAAREHDVKAAERAAHVAELKAAHDAGELNTPERVERAATNLLEG